MGIRSISNGGRAAGSSAPTPFLGRGTRHAGVVVPYGGLRKASSTTPASRRIAERLRQRPRGTTKNRRKDHQKGSVPTTTQAALSEAESAERVAGQIRSLPDDLRVQHGVHGSEVC